MKWKYALASVVMLLVLVAGGHLLRQQMQTWSAQQPWRQASKRDESRLSEAILQRQSAVAVTVTGRIVKLLTDEGPRARGEPQRFMLEIGSGLTLPVQYGGGNASRVEGLEYGSQVTVSGRYDWDALGGVLYCATSVSAPGWLEFHGRRYPAAAVQ